MGGQANTQQPVFYDPEMSQYYTQTPQSNSPFAGALGNQVPNGMFANQPTGNDLYSNAFYAMFAPSGQRNYLNNFGQSSPAMQPQAPYEYADTSLASLFPMLQGQSQGGALDGLLNGTPSAVGMAQQDAQARAAAPTSSGAGRFL
jgi:hypothetical protein